MRLQLLSPCSVSNSGPGTWPVVTFEHFSASLWPSRRYLDLQMRELGLREVKSCAHSPEPPELGLCTLPLGCMDYPKPCPQPGREAPSFARAFPSQGGLCAMHWGLWWGERSACIWQLIFLQRKASSTLVTEAGLLTLSMAPFSDQENEDDIIHVTELWELTDIMDVKSFLKILYRTLFFAVGNNTKRQRLDQWNPGAALSSKEKGNWTVVWFCCNFLSVLFVVMQNRHMWGSVTCHVQSEHRAALFSFGPPGAPGFLLMAVSWKRSPLHSGICFYNECSS